MSSNIQQTHQEDDEQPEKENIEWTDTNVGMIRSPEDKAVKKKAAQGEEAWEDAGKKVGIQIWRINKFKVESVPKEEYGRFFEGDSYIILRTYKMPDSEELNYDLFFWIGKDSTQDEYGTAAYKTVELDTLLDDKPVQYREVCKHESEKFKYCFKGGIHYEKGGHESGFNKVTETVLESKMYKIKEMKNNPNSFTVKQVDMKWEKIYADSVVLLVTNDNIYQFNGPKAPHKLKYAMRQRISDPLLRIRSDIKCSTVEGMDDLCECFSKDLGDPPADFDINREKPEREESVEDVETILYRLKDGVVVTGDANQNLENWDVVVKGDAIPNLDTLDFDDGKLYMLDFGKGVSLLDLRKKSNRKESALIHGQQLLETKGKKMSRVPMNCVKNKEELRKMCRK